MNNSRTSAVARVFQANSVGSALGLVWARFCNEVTSRMASVRLDAPGLHLGSGCRVIGGRRIAFGRNVRAGRNLWLEAVTSYRSQQFEPTIQIGDHVCFSDDVHISSIQSIVIGDHVLFGSRIYVSDHNHGIYTGAHQSRPEEPPAQRSLGGGGPVSIGTNAWIGDNVTIVGPACIGSGTIIGANSVVRGTVPPNSMAVGSPARVIKKFNSETGLWERA